MGTHDITFFVPPSIETGLASGTLERIGGVIREVQSKRVVAWLRDITGVDASPEVLHILGLMRFAKLATFSGLMLNLAISTSTLLKTKRQIDAAVSKLDAILEKLDRNLEVEFESALEIAHTLDKLQNVSVKEHQAVATANRLEIVIRHYISLAEDSLAKAEIKLAQYYLECAFCAVQSHASCWLSINEVQYARNSLQQDLQRLHEITKKTVKAILGKAPAAFLHPELSEEEVKRFFIVQKWLQERDFFEILNELRGDFWNPGIFSASSNRKLSFTRREKSGYTVQGLAALLEQAEIIIENYQRLQSFEMEMIYLRLSSQSFEDWQHEVAQNSEGEAGGIMLICPAEPVSLDNLSN